MDKKDVIYIYTHTYICVYTQTQNGVLLSHKKKNETMPFAATWMDLEIIILSEVSQRQISYGITYMCKLKNNTNESMYKTETDSETQETSL